MFQISCYPVFDISQKEGARMDITVTDRVEMIDTLGQLRPGDCIH